MLVSDRLWKDLTWFEKSFCSIWKNEKFHSKLIFKICSNPLKVCQIIERYLLGQQKILLKSGLIWDDPFPKLFHLYAFFILCLSDEKQNYSKQNKQILSSSWVWVILAVSYPKDIHQQQNSWQISIKHDFFYLRISSSSGTTTLLLFCLSLKLLVLWFNFSISSSCNNKQLS